MSDHNAQRAEHLERIALLAGQLPADAVISHESAALVHGLALYTVPRAVRVTRTRGRVARTSDLRLYVASLRPSDRGAVSVIPVTSLARTVVDIGRWLPFGEALVTADAALRSGVTQDALADVLRHQWTWPRVRRAMPVVRSANARAESPLESFVRSRIIWLRLPMPSLQHNVYGEYGWVARSDFGWPDYGAVGEADGKVKYLTEDIWREKQRQEDIEDAGFEVIRWIWRTAHAPDQEFTRRLRRTLSRGLALRRLRDAG